MCPSPTRHAVYQERRYRRDVEKPKNLKREIEMETITLSPIPYTLTPTSNAKAEEHFSNVSFIEKNQRTDHKQAKLKESISKKMGDKRKLAKREIEDQAAMC